MIEVTFVCYLWYLLLPSIHQITGVTMRKHEVIEYFGGVSKTASTLGISHPAVCRWGEVIPEKQAFVIERLTNGKLKYDANLYQKSTNAGVQ